MTWLQKEPRHGQPWHLPNYSGMFRFKDQEGLNCESSDNEKISFAHKIWFPYVSQFRKSHNDHELGGNSFSSFTGAARYSRTPHPKLHSWNTVLLTGCQSPYNGIKETGIQVGVLQAFWVLSKYIKISYRYKDPHVWERRSLYWDGPRRSMDFEVKRCEFSCCLSTEHQSTCLSWEIIRVPFHNTEQIFTD